MTTLTDRIPVDVDAITEQARTVHFGRSVLTLIAAILFGVGWLAARIVGLLWFAAVWGACAIREGWREARKTPQGPSQVR